MSYGGQVQNGIRGPPPGSVQNGPSGPQNGPQPTARDIQFMLDENCQLIQSIIDYQQKGNLV
jgi:hypothetical protein